MLVPYVWVHQHRRQGDVESRVQSTTPSGSSPRPNPPSPLGVYFFFFLPSLTRGPGNYQPAGTNLGRPTNRLLFGFFGSFFFGLFFAPNLFFLPLHNHHHTNKVLSDRPLYNTRQSSSSSASSHGAKEGPHASHISSVPRKRVKRCESLFLILALSLSNPSHLHTGCAHFCKRTLPWWVMRWR